MTGHLEYDTETLANEYFRDKNKGLEIQIPRNYFPDDDSAQHMAKHSPPFLFKLAELLRLSGNTVQFVIFCLRCGIMN